MPAPAERRPSGPLRRLAARLEPFLRAAQEEQPRLVLACAYIFLVVAAIALTKPLRNSLYISAFGVEGLPYAYLGVAAVSALFIWLYARVSSRAGTRSLVLSCLWSGCSGLAGFWVLHVALPAGSPLRGAAAAAFYVALAVFAVIASSQVWVLANLAFDARQARRLFGYVATGGIAGGIAGGYLASWAAPRWGGPCLLPVGAAFLAGAAWAADGLWHRAAALTGRAGAPAGRGLSLGRGERVSDLWRDVLHSPHARWLALMVGLATVAGALAEFQFSALAAAALGNGDRLTAFFGFWLSNLSVFSLVVQLAVSYALLRRHGVGASLLVLPLAVAGGGLAVLIWPSLWTGVAAKIGDASLKHSLNKNATELLYLPLPARLRERAKMFIDVFVDNLATGIAGALLLFLSRGPGLSPRLVSALLLATVAAWIPAILRARREYLGSFRKAMEKRALNASRETLAAGEAGLLESLERALEDANPRRVLYALDWLEPSGGGRRVAGIGRLLRHADAAVRLRALQILRRGGHVGWEEDARGLARRDPDGAVRLAALRYLLRLGRDPVSFVLPYLMGDDAGAKETALHALCLEAQRRPALAARVDWRALLDGVGGAAAAGAGDPAGLRGRTLRKVRARLIGVAALPEAWPELVELLGDPDPEVREAALAAAGDARDSSLLPALYPHLLSSRTRPLARAAIAAHGEPAIPALRAALADPAQPAAVRRRLPQALGALGSQAAAAALVEILPSPDLALRFEAIKSLNGIKRAAPHFRFPSEALDRAIRVELDGRRALGAAQDRVGLALAGRDPGLPLPGRRAAELRLLARALREKARQAEERLFRLLGLRYHADDAYGAWLGLSSGSPAARANAVELLDNVLPARLRRALLPLVEPRARAVPEAGPGFRAEAWPHWLGGLLGDGMDDWIRVLALHLAADSGEPALRARAEALSRHPDPRLRDMALAALAVPAGGALDPAVPSFHLREADAQPH